MNDRAYYVVARRGARSTWRPIGTRSDFADAYNLAESLTENDPGNVAAGTAVEAQIVHASALTPTSRDAFDAAIVTREIRRAERTR